MDQPGSLVLGLPRLSSLAARRSLCGQEIRELFGHQALFVWLNFSRCGFAVAERLDLPDYRARKMDIKALQRTLAAFAAERDWQQFHSPKNLAMALAAESGELLELFQWLSEPQSRQLNAQQRAAVEQELADILFYLLRLADQLQIDMEAATERKLEINAERYPVDLAKGNATKYSRRD